MRWRMEFRKERQAIVACYGVEASTPAAAVRVGRDALLTEYPTIPTRQRQGLFAQAQRVGGQDASGWVLDRIVKD
jgi:hypothetical protein